MLTACPSQLNNTLFQGTIGFDGTILENDQSWLLTMATLANIPRRAVSLINNCLIQFTSVSLNKTMI